MKPLDAMKRPGSVASHDTCECHSPLDSFLSRLVESSLLCFIHSRRSPSMLLLDKEKCRAGIRGDSEEWTVPEFISVSSILISGGRWPKLVHTSAYTLSVWFVQYVMRVVGRGDLQEGMGAGISTILEIGFLEIGKVGLVILSTMLFWQIH